MVDGKKWQQHREDEKQSGTAFCGVSSRSSFLPPASRSSVRRLFWLPSLFIHVLIFWPPFFLFLLLQISLSPVEHSMSEPASCSAHKAYWRTEERAGVSKK